MSNCEHRDTEPTPDRPSADRGGRAPVSVLFLCTGNSCRSVMAESALNRIGAGRFRAHSAGSHPTGAVNEHAVRLLAELGYPVAGLRSKSWDEFAGDDAPPIDIVVTVCDRAAGESCPLWPGGPAKAHWGFPDPAAFVGDEATTRAHFAEVFATIERRIEALAALPVERLERPELEARLAELAPPSLD